MPLTFAMAEVLQTQTQCKNILQNPLCDQRPRFFGTAILQWSKSVSQIKISSKEQKRRKRSVQTVREDKLKIAKEWETQNK